MIKSSHQWSPSIGGTQRRLRREGGWQERVMVMSSWWRMLINIYIYNRFRFNYKRNYQYLGIYCITNVLGSCELLLEFCRLDLLSLLCLKMGDQLLIYAMQSCYSLVKIYITMEKSTMLWKWLNPLFLWSCQRVYVKISMFHIFYIWNNHVSHMFSRIM